MLHMVVMTHGPDTCAAVHPESGAMARNAMDKMDEMSKKHQVIVQESTNSVRASVKLMPLTKDIFRSRYMSGINGEHVRFYRD